MITASRQNVKFVHPLARFVTRDAIALHLNLNPEQIYKIDCWNYVVHVVGKGTSIFVSYADLPPILGVEPPTLKDILKWRKRWRKYGNKAPQFWVEFYANKLRTAATAQELQNWYKLINSIHFAFPNVALRWLQGTSISAKTGS